MQNKVRYFLMLFLLSIPGLNLFASAPDTAWTRTFGGADGDGAYSVSQTADNGFIICGASSSFGSSSYDVYLQKTDYFGDSVWVSTFGGANYDYGRSVKQTYDGGYIIAGYTESFGPAYYNLYLVKADSSGDSLWAKAFGGSDYDFGYAVEQTSDSGFIVTGTSGPSNYEDLYLVRTDKVGDTLWTRKIGGYYTDEGWAVKETTDKGFIITGSSYSSGNDDILLLKTDSLGDSLWARRFGTSSDDRGYSLQLTHDGGYMIAGYTNESGYGDVYLIKTDSLGNDQWIKSFGGGDDDRGYSLAQTSDSGYIVVGLTESYGAGNADCYMLRGNKNGDTIWVKTIGGNLNDEAWSVEQTNDGGFIVAGKTYSYGSGSSDAYLIKIDSEGGVGEGNDINQLNILRLHPNPFNRKITVSFELPEKRELDIFIYNILGQKVRSLFTGTKERGSHHVSWDGRDESKNRVKSGVYFLRIKTEEEYEYRKILLLR